MRIDKFLKVSRIVKRRTIAKELAENDRILINGRMAKPATEVAVNDILEITFGQKVLKIRVLELREFVRKDESSMMYEIVE